MGNQTSNLPVNNNNNNNNDDSSPETSQQMFMIQELQRMNMDTIENRANIEAILADKKMQKWVTKMLQEDNGAKSRSWRKKLFSISSPSTSSPLRRGRGKKLARSGSLEQARFEQALRRSSDNKSSPFKDNKTALAA
jgi:hypothetical protein